MNSWIVYIARDLESLVVGVCNDVVSEETLLNSESEWTTNYRILWFVKFKTKTEALLKFKDVSVLDDIEKNQLILNSQKIIIIEDDMEVDPEKFSLVRNLRFTLNLVQLLQNLPELWKLNDKYLDNVAEYLDIKTSQVINAKLWDICIDTSKNVGLITKDKFYPVIKY